MPQFDDHNIINFSVSLKNIREITKSKIYKNTSHKLADKSTSPKSEKLTDAPGRLVLGQLSQGEKMKALAFETKFFHAHLLQSFFGGCLISLTHMSNILVGIMK